MVIAWDLGVQMRQKSRSSILRSTDSNSSGRWEMMTGWADDAYDEEEDFEVVSDGDVLGDVTLPRRRGSSGAKGSINVQPQWEVDVEALQSGLVCANQYFISLRLSLTLYYW